MKTNDLKPCKELEEEIMEFIFSNKCTDHHAALEVWNNNPWVAVSMYEIEHYPENLQWQVAFPKEVEIPSYFQRMLENEEARLMQGKPVINHYPRANPATYTSGDVTLVVNKFGRITVEKDDQEEDY